MAKPIKGKDGKFQGSVGEGRTKTPTAAPEGATSPAHTGSPAHPAYGDQFDRMKAATSKPTRIENGVTWTETNREHRERDGWTIVDEQTTGVYSGLKSEGYSGVKPGETVTVNRVQYIRPDGTVANEHYSCSAGGAWLSVYQPKDDLRLNGATYTPEKRRTNDIMVNGAAVRLYRHQDAQGQNYTWSADATIRNTSGDGRTTVENVWEGDKPPTEQDLKDALQAYRDNH